MTLEKIDFEPKSRFAPQVVTYAVRGTDMVMTIYYEPIRNYTVEFLTSLRFPGALNVLRYTAKREGLNQRCIVVAGAEISQRSERSFPLTHSPNSIRTNLRVEPQYMRLEVPNGHYVWNDIKIPEVTQHKGAIVSVTRMVAKLPVCLPDFVQKFVKRIPRELLLTAFSEFERELGAEST